MKDLQDYDQNGVVKLYHFSTLSTPKVTLDPEEARKKFNSFSMREYRNAGTPRIFYYLDIGDKEHFFDKTYNLYTTSLPLHKIYDLTKDPDGLIQKTLDNNNGIIDYDALFNNIKGRYQEKLNPKLGYRSEVVWRQRDKRYDAVYYKTGFQVIVAFTPLTAKLVKQDQKNVAFV
jgi:hypothetical protein